MTNQQFIFDFTDESNLRDSLIVRNATSVHYVGEWHSNPHAHNYTELFYVISGQGQFCVDDECFTVTANQLVIINPDVMHNEKCFETQSLEYITIGLEGIRLCPKKTRNTQFRIFSYSSSETILECMKNILHEMQSQASQYQAVCKAYAEILATLLGRYESISSQSSSLTSRQCLMVRQYIDQHYKDRLTLELLAQVADSNKYYLAHNYKKAYGISPISYMITCRIKEAKQLLSETDLPLSKISRNLGFSSPSYFSQSFSKIEGIGPADYRKLHSHI